MKSTKKIISLILSVVMLFGICAVSMVVSADETSPIIKFTPLTRNYTHGEWPEEVTYTSGGYITMKESSFCKQKQILYTFGYDKAAAAEAEDLVYTALDGEGLFGWTCNIIDCYATTEDDPKTTEVEYYKKNGAEMRIGINYICGYDDEPGEIYKGNVYLQKWQTKLGQDTEYKLSAADFEEFDWFIVYQVLVGAMNYANPANSLGESGLGDFEIECSPVYVYGEGAPEKGEAVEFDPEAWSWETKEDLNYLWPLTDPYADEPETNTGEAKGPYGDGLDIKRDEYGYPINAEGVVCDFEGNPLPDATIGDVNDDGNVNGKDVLALRKYIVGLIGEADINVDAADCNYDGNINGKDVLQLRKAIIGLVEL